MNKALQVACWLALGLLAGCSRPADPNAEPPLPTASELQGGTIVIAAELGALGDELAAALQQCEALRILTVTRAAAGELATTIQAVAPDAVAVFAPGPEDLVPLSGAGLLAEAGGLTLGEAPLLLVTRTDDPGAPADLADLAAGEGRLGVPDATAGHCRVVVEKLLAAQPAPLEPDRVVAAGLDQLRLQLASGELVAALLPGYAVAWDDQTYRTRPVDGPRLAVMAAALRSDAPGSESAARHVLALARRDPVRGALLTAGLTLPSAEPEPANGAQPALFVHAGAGLREPLQEAAKRFQAATGTTVRYNFTGSACLLAQLTMGHKGDVYIPGEEYFLDQAAERGYVVDRAKVAYFILVMAVRKGNPLGLASLDDLTRKGVRVGLGEPKSCAVGSFTQQALESYGLLDGVNRNVVMRTLLAPELGNALQLGAIDACINWDAVAAWYTANTDVIPLPLDETIVSPVVAATLTFAKQPEAAKRFVDWLAGPDGQAVFREFNYTVDLAAPIFGDPGAAR